MLFHMHSGIEGMILDIFWTACVMCVAWVAAYAAGAALPGTRAAKRRQEVQEAQHAVHVGRLRQIEDRLLDERLMLPSGEDK